jgi:2-oxoglutarate dehydrogenase E1 component
LIAVFSDVTEVEKLRNSLRDMRTVRVEQLLHAYRERGHIKASIDPLSRHCLDVCEDLDPATYDLCDQMDSVFTVSRGCTFVTQPLHEIIDTFEQIYCSSLAVQYMHIDNKAIQGWLRDRIEAPDYGQPLSRDEQLRILRKLIDAEHFETFVQKNYSRAKRFSLEGGETLIPLLDQSIAAAARHGCGEIVIGMSHRGRLNVLANILQLPESELFRRLAYDSDANADCVDVPVHLGEDVTIELSAGDNVDVALCFNPSHLESIGPVVLGRARARQDAVGGESEALVLPIIVHGDAAFAGQGIVQETFNLSGLAAYSTGGALHIIVNNGIGFTTEPEQGRSTRYATDVARMRQIPIFHVNGENPEAVDRVVRLAMDFWSEWRTDVVIDMHCYRRRGHMELDDPTFTQPQLYDLINERQTLRQRYVQNLVSLGQVTADECAVIEQDCVDRLASQHTVYGGADTAPETVADDCPTPPPTAVDASRLAQLLGQLTVIPDNFTPHVKIAAVLKRRRKMGEGKARIDWGTAEALAFASLLSNGISIRLTGQDCERGTFAHRHAVLHDRVSGQPFRPLIQFESEDARIAIHNSPLSEAAVLAFEFGYSLEQRQSLTIWEAQFGDFANAAQVIIDQFVVSAAEKWNQHSNLVILLPHGLEGHGPEHSSARPERYLQLCARENMTVACPTSAGQVFHLLRQQALQTITRPLIVFTPKRLLQGNASASRLDELSDGSFSLVRHETSDMSSAKLVICYGHFAALLATSRKASDQPYDILRIEQLYPFPAQEIQEAIQEGAYSVVAWAQEEPENMGPWRWLEPKLHRIFDGLQCIARRESASPAGGSHAEHDRQTADLIDRINRL